MVVSATVPPDELEASLSVQAPELSFGSQWWGASQRLGMSSKKMRWIFCDLTRQKLKKSRTQIYMDLSYIDPQAKVLHHCFE